MKAQIVCAHCSASAMKEKGAINRAGGAPMYCSRRCFGVSRRVERSADELRRRKAEYDAKRRSELADEIREQKREYHQRTYDPEKAREYRQGRTFDHTAYCRRYYADPAKKREKVEYDIQRRATAYADFAEAWRLLIELEKEIRTRCPDKYERQKARGYFTRINKDELWQTLQSLRDGSLTPGAGDAVASQAREILRTVRTQLAIFTQSGKSVTNELIDFAKPTDE